MTAASFPRTCFASALAAVAAVSMGCAEPRLAEIEAVLPAGVSFTHRPLTGKLLVGSHSLEVRGRALASGPAAAAESTGVAVFDSVELVLVLRQGARPPRTAQLRPFAAAPGGERVWRMDLPLFREGTRVEYHLEARRGTEVLARLPPADARESAFRFDVVTPVPRLAVMSRRFVMGCGVGALVLAALLAFAGRAATNRDERLREEGWAVLLAAAGATLYFAAAIPLTWITTYLATSRIWPDGAYRGWSPSTRAVLVVLYWFAVAVASRRVLLGRGAAASGEPLAPRALPWMLLAGTIAVAVHLVLGPS